MVGDPTKPAGAVAEAVPDVVPGAAQEAAGEADWSRRRADARRNHERVLAAAIEVFTEHGLGATMPQVAERAGVGKATVYRSFPTKAHLVRALAQTHADWLKANIAAAAESAEVDAYRALERAIEETTGRLARDRLMIEVMAGAEGREDPETTRLTERILELGIEQGTLRADVTSMDIQVLVGGMARALIALEVSDPDVWRRYAQLSVAALRP